MTQSSEPIYDIAIIGGGIAGCGIARDAALRGIKTVLFEAGTIGCGTSSKSSKLIHGGIRYLELSWIALCRGALSEAWKNFRFVFLSLKESRTLHQIAPDLVKPIPLIIPVYKNGPRNPLALYLGAVLYSFLALVCGRGRFGRIFGSKKSIMKRMPELNPEGLAGGIMIWDHVTDDVALTRATAASAKKNGAHVFENSKVTGFEYDFDKNIYNIRVERLQETANPDGHKISKTAEVSYQAKKLLNATGPWVDKTRGLLRDKDFDENLLQPVAGAHLVLPRFLGYSVILQAADGRVFFVINVGGHSRVGTTEWTCEDPDRVTVREEDVDYLLGSLGRYFPEKKFTRADILFSDAAIRPLAKPPQDQRFYEISREHEIHVDHAGVIHVLGVKLTDHRRAAKEIVDELVPEIIRTHPEIKTTTATHKIRLLD